LRTERDRSTWLRRTGGVGARSDTSSSPWRIRREVGGHTGQAIHMNHMKIRSSFVPVAVGVMLGVASTAWATLAPRWSDQELADLSEVVVTGRVVSVATIDSIYT
jgi:hypothetical protein